MSKASGSRQRLRFEDLQAEVSPGGRLLVIVRLEWCGSVHGGKAEALDTPQGRVQAAAHAAVSAALDATGRGVELAVVGIKAVRAFDGWVVVTRVNGRANGNEYRLLGSAPCEEEDDLTRAAVLAVLDASNRVLEKYVAG